MAINSETIWICTTRGRLLAIDTGSLSVREYQVPGQSLAVSGDGLIYLVSPGGSVLFAEFDPATGRLTDLSGVLGLEQGETPRHIVAGGKDLLWVVTLLRAIAYDPVSGSSMYFPFPLRQVDENGRLLGAPMEFLNVAVDDNGGLWFADRCWYGCVGTIRPPR
jgi:streptogramin lyase